MTNNKSLESLKNEMFMILQLCWVEQRLDFKIALGSGKLTRADFLEIFYSIQVINNDITVRLNKFVDSRKDVCSLFSIIKELKLTRRAKTKPDLDEIKKSIELFTKVEFKELQERRNNKLAHLKKEFNNNWLEDAHVLGPVLTIRDFLDQLNGKEIEYIWKDPYLDKDIDLRDLV